MLLFLIVGSVAVLNRQTPAEHEEGNWWCKILMCEGFFWGGVILLYFQKLELQLFFSYLHKYPRLNSQQANSVQVYSPIFSHCHAVVMHGNYFFGSRSRLFPASLKYSLTVGDPVTLYPLPWIHNLARELRSLWTSAVYYQVGLPGFGPGLDRTLMILTVTFLQPIIQPLWGRTQSLWR